MNSTLDDDDRTDNELPCPIPGCDYTNDKPQGIAGHVGHHDGGWDAADADPVEIHQAATAADESASRRVAKVEAYLARHGIQSAAVRVYEHQGYGTVQIDVDGYLGDLWDAYRDATDVGGIRYVGDGRSYCTDKFVEQLRPPQRGEVCQEPECNRTDTLSPVIEGGEPITLCRTCRKEFWGVSS